MFIYPNNSNGIASESGTNTSIKLENAKKWLAYQRFFGRKTPFIKGEDDFEELELLLNHFYDVEIDKTYKFSEVKLINGVIRNFFDSVDIVNL